MNELEILRKLAAPLLEEMRMLADWQIRERGYDPQVITMLCRAKDEREQAAKDQKLIARLS